jgi:hypothetical protein
MLKITYDKNQNFDFKKFNSFLFSVEVFQDNEKPLVPPPPPPSIENIHHLSLFSFVVGNFALLDPDSQTQLNPDPKHCLPTSPPISVFIHRTVPFFFRPFAQVCEG